MRGARSAHRQRARNRFAVREEGAAVACVDKDETAARQTRDQIMRDGGAASVIVADVTREQDCERLVAEAMRDLRAIDGSRA